jgi:PAS domain S-box-containing protein
MAGLRFRHSRLARRIQLQIGLVIALVIVGVTWVGYQQSVQSTREEVLGNLQNSTRAKAAFEAAVFVDGQNNTYALRDEYLRRLTLMGNADPVDEFNAWFVRYPDGLIRVRPERDDHKHLPSIYIRSQAPLDATLRRQVVVAFNLLREWGPVMTLRYYSAYIDLPGLSLIMYSPSVNWGKEADATTNNFDYPPVQNSAPDKNPRRDNLWTEVYFDDKAGIWMVSTITPIDQGRWLGTASQDIAIDQLLLRTTNEAAPGTYNLIMDQRGRLVAHPSLMSTIQKSAGNLDVKTLGDPLLLDIFAEASKTVGQAQVRTSPDGNFYLGIARIRGPEWYFVTVYPKSLVERPGLEAARSILITGMLGLMLELALLAWIIRRQVAAPLEALSNAAQSIAHGDMQVTLNVSAADELGQLAQSFMHMTDKLRERDDVLKRRALELEREVANREHVQASLAQSEVFKDTLLHTIPDVVFVKDAQGRFIAANRAFEAIYGKTFAEIQGKTDFEFLPYEQAEYFSHRDRDAMNAGGPTVSEAWQTNHQSGLSTLFETIKTPVAGVDGHPIGLLGIGRDITDRKRSQDALQAMNLDLEARVRGRTQELELANEELTQTVTVLRKTQKELVQGEKLASLGRMVAGVAHELNTPIGNALTIGTTIAEHSRGMKRLMQSDGLKKSNLTEFLNATEEGAHVLERALRQAHELISNFKQVSADQLSERRRVFNLATTVDELVSTMRPGWRNARFQLVLEIPSTIEMDGYPGLLGQVLSNLIANAALHAFEDATAGIVTVHAQDLGEQVQLSVSDNGAGIALEHQGQIFDPFFTTRMGRGGTGLGLSIVHTVVTQGLRGQVVLDSTWSPGARFVVTIPKNVT